MIYQMCNVSNNDEHQQDPKLPLTTDTRRLSMVVPINMQPTGELNFLFFRRDLSFLCQKVRD